MKVAMRADMRAFASLQRSGNFVTINHMIRHADVLALGGMKLLQLDMVDGSGAKKPWLKGVRYLLHGAIEDGGNGLADWRRYVHQCPTLLSYKVPDVEWMPADFDPAVYLQLHPDVRAARVDPRKHYLWHGMLEGRSYKINQISSKRNSVRNRTRARDKSHQTHPDQTKDSLHQSSERAPSFSATRAAARWSRLWSDNDPELGQHMGASTPYLSIGRIYAAHRMLPALSAESRSPGRKDRRMWSSSGLHRRSQLEGSFDFERGW